ncbi:MAG: hypothetical protein EAZ20_14365 [Bacteroidetes bacterium]|nr:MAG: hypothetical protein EAZ20_14365 [Bacteroidota bacterium]
MAENTYRKSANNSSEKSKKEKINIFEIFKKISFFPKNTTKTEQGISPKYIPYILFWAALALIYISNAHQGEKAVRQTTKLEAEVENLRADYITLKAAYDAFAGKQSEIVKSADTLGLVNDKEKVKRILITEPK